MALSQGLLAVSGRLDRAGTVGAAEALVVVLGKSIPFKPAEKLSQALMAVSGRLSTPDLLAVLQNPLAAGPAQRTLLEVLAQRTRRDFRTPWEFLDWAAANGVDLTPPKR